LDAPPLEGSVPVVLEAISIRKLVEKLVAVEVGPAINENVDGRV
jgi:hypothetical protein